MWISVFGKCTPYLLLFTAAHRNAFSLTHMHRNLFIVRSSAAGLLPQAKAPWSPWQPCNSDGRRGVEAGRAAALSHRPPALIRRGQDSLPSPSAPPFKCPSVSAVFVCERESGCFSYVLWLCLFPSFRETVNHPDPWGSEASGQKSETSNTNVFKVWDCVQTKLGKRKPRTPP